MVIARRRRTSYSDDVYVSFPGLPPIPQGLAMCANDSVLSRLMQVIEDRKAHPPERSYTTSLFRGGVEKIGGKILEEAREVVEAAGEPGDDGRRHLVAEAADVIYHLLVMLAHRDARLSDVEAELGRRFGISGLDEKASRTHE